MRPAEILRAAKEEISDPARWCQGEPAVDAFDSPCDAKSPKAVRRCAYGALDVVCGDNTADYLAAIRFLIMVAPQGVSRANDAGPHADVMAMFDRAIAIAELQELSGARSVE